jgi:hypothetical protein
MHKQYRYTIRFNLARGLRYLTWKIYDRWTMSAVYVDRNQVSLLLIDCLLVNQKTQAVKIYDGAHKTVCAHISCNHIQFELPGLFNELNQVMYNPRVLPYWVEDGIDVDGKTYNKLLTVSNQVFIGEV